MKSSITYPAEWENQAATWLAFPHNKKNWPGERGVKIRKFYIQLIRTISEFQPVNVFVPNAKFLTLDEKFALADRPFPVSIFFVPTNDIWIRDFGPFFVRVDKEVQIAETKFNAWGAKFPPWEKDDAIPSAIAKIFGYKKVPAVPYIFEGGAIEVNGDGLGITTLDCLVGKNRNKIADLSKVIKSLCKIFGLKSLLILPRGLHGDHTDGHIDNVARFVAKDRVVVASEKNCKSENAATLREAKLLIESWLKNFYGKKAVVDTLQLPPQRKLADGQILPASYINFIFANGALIYPKYKCAADKAAQQYFEKVFPGRMVIGLDARTVIEEGGSLHCISKQECR